jgi:ATP-dependent helicase/nuclease subunit A
LHDLHALAQDNHETPLWETLTNFQQIDTLSADGRSRLANLVAVFTANLAYLTHLDLRDLVEKTWRDLGGEKCVSNSNEFKIVQKYWQLLDNCQTDLEPEILTAKLAALFAEPEPNPDYQLQIMTIHKAKGLEFDTVIIPGLNREPRQDHEPLLLWSERPNAQSHADSDLILAPIKAVGTDPDPVYRYLKFEESQKNYYETGRLLYVAVTRAKKRLHLLAAVKDDKPNRKSLLEQIWPCFQDLAPLAPIAVPAVKSTTKYLRRLVNPVDLTIKPHNDEILRAPSYRGLTAVSTNENKTAQNIGIVIHKCLEQLSKVDLDNWLEKNLAAARNAWLCDLMQLGTYENLEQHIATIELAITNALSDPIGRWILNKDHQDAHSEYTLAAVIDNEIKHIQIDRTLIAENKRWIIDYKNSNNDSINYTQYRAQLLTYAKAMQALDPNTPIALGIYFPLSGEWEVFSV